MDSGEFKKIFQKIKYFLLAPKNKEFLIFLLFFIASSAFWLLQTLNEVFDVEVEIPITLVNVPSNVVITSELPKELRVSLRDKGTTMMRYMYGASQQKIVVDYKKYDEGQVNGRVMVSQQDVLKQIQAQLLSSTKVVSVKPDTLEFFLNRGSRKKVPIRLAGTLNASPECYIESVTFEPDSVEVLAPPVILDTIKDAYIIPVHATDLKRSVVQTKLVHRVRGAKYIPEQVDVRINVDMYTEKTVSVPIIGLNFPADRDLRTFPGHVDVSFRIGMKHFKEVNANDFVLGLTYEELLNNTSSKVRLNLKSLPEGISNVRISPREVDYLIEQVRKDEKDKQRMAGENITSE